VGYETAIGPTLRTSYREKREPNSLELEDLLTFMALQWVRVPAFRPRVFALMDSLMRDHFNESLESPETWSAAMAKARIPPDEPGSTFEEIKAFQASGDYSLKAETEFYLVEAFKGNGGNRPSPETKALGSKNQRKRELRCFR
jgi:hypothetical protein